MIRATFKFEELRVYQESLGWTKEIYTLTKTWPPEEQFWLTSQLRRAAVSISLNIAEGTSRSSTKEFQHFLDIARGSSYECYTIIQIAKSQGLISPMKEPLLSEYCNRMAGMINALKASLDKDAASQR